MFFNPLEVGMKPPPFKHTVYNALVVPRPIGWISTMSKDGVVNLAPFSFFNALSGDPPCVMYCPNAVKPDTGEKKDSYQNAQDTGEFVFNMCTWGSASRDDRDRRARALQRRRNGQGRSGSCALP